MSKIEEIVKLWKQLKVEAVHFEFSCGGDSMNDTSVVIIGANGKTIQNNELEHYFDNEVYNRVQFYEASDGHYQGEAGTVEITYDESEGDFDYSKQSQSEWSEMVDSHVFVELTDAQAKFVRDKVLNINGGEGEEPAVNYKGDCILTDEDEKIEQELCELIKDYTGSYTPEEHPGELQDWYNYTTNEQGEEITLNGNKLKLRISNSCCVFTDGD